MIFSAPPAYNPNLKRHTRKQYEAELEDFRKQCTLVKYLGKTMTTHYQEPEQRDSQFDGKMNEFLAFKDRPFKKPLSSNQPQQQLQQQPQQQSKLKQ